MKKTYTKSLIFLLKLSISLAALAYIIYKIRGEGGEIWQQVGAFDIKDVCFTLLCLLLLLLNQGLEAKKWQILIQNLYPNLTFNTAIQAVLAGNTAGIFTPNRLGEYAGRVFFLPQGKRIEAASLTVIDRFFQMLITLYLGWAAAILTVYFFPEKIVPFFSVKNIYALLLFIGICCLFLTFLLIFPHKLLAWAARKPIFFRWQIVEKSLFALANVPSTTLAKVFVLSLVRNLTFSFQYYLLMLSFGYGAGIGLALLMIWLIYIIKSVIPSISLAELGIRESVALAVMQVFGIHAIIAISSTFLLYLINIALPALAGVLVMRTKK